MSNILNSIQQENVRELIDFVSLVDPGTCLHSVSVGPDEVDWSTISGSQDYTAKVLERLEKSLAVLPSAIAKEIGLDLSVERIFEDYIAVATFSPDPLSLESFSAELNTNQDFFLQWARRSILESADRYERFRSHYHRIYKLLDYLEQREGVPDDIKVLIPVPDIFTANVGLADNALVLVPDELTNALIGADLSKMKRCPACRRVFWLSRKDQKGCSRPCANVLRTRKWRDKTTEEQRSKYNANRALKELKEERRKQ